MAGEATSFHLAQRYGKQEPEKKIYGVTVCQVINNIDCTGGARVQLMLPWLPGYQPWARMSNMMGGMGRGSYFIPQIGDEVLVAFNQGDVREPYILGTLWNTIDRPPAIAPTDSVTKRKIRTPLGHELSFDELLQSVTLSSNTMSTVTLDLEKAEISTPTATIKVGKLGDVSITAKTKLTLDAPVIEIKARTKLTLSSNLAATLQAAAICEVKGATVKIN
jgi:uncharacterized protein involved in type VI secretion and phage assembly